MQTAKGHSGFAGLFVIVEEDRNSWTGVVKAEKHADFPRRKACKLVQNIVVSQTVL